jgi:hypothetical protein
VHCFGFFSGNSKGSIVLFGEFHRIQIIDITPKSSRVTLSRVFDWKRSNKFKTDTSGLSSSTSGLNRQICRLLFQTVVSFSRTYLVRSIDWLNSSKSPRDNRFYFSQPISLLSSADPPTLSPAQTLSHKAAFHEEPTTSTHRLARRNVARLSLPEPPAHPREAAVSKRRSSAFLAISWNQRPFAHFSTSARISV